MKTITILVTMLFGLFTCAQQTATTEDGKKVILRDNGKWEYVKVDTSAVKIDARNFTKSEAAKTLVKSEKNNFAVWYDSKKWKKEEKKTKIKYPSQEII